MYRTDKQFMTNPATSACRVYVGALPKTTTPQDLEQRFQVYGKILGLVLQQGFAFIQFENEAQAYAAIQNENQSMFYGRRITVRQALEKNQKAPPSQFPNKNGPQNQQSNSAMNQQKKFIGPLIPPQNQPPNQFNQQNQFQHNPNQQGPSSNKSFEEPIEHQMGDEQPNQPPPLLEKQQPQAPPPPQTLQAPPPPQQQISPHESLHNENKRSRKRKMRDRYPVEPYRDDYYPREDNYPPVGYGAPPILDQPPPPERNDCEIIVVSKILTKYAEYIEQRLKSLGLIVDLLFPNEDVPIGKVLANISSRGCLYAILVMPQNEEQRSLTLNILHGIPQEHRNMPIEDALILITRNFDAYMRGDKMVLENQIPGQMAISDRHPSSIQLLLNLLAENRQITTTQYDKLLKYLQERRELQHQHEVAEGVDQDSQESNSKQAELQNRIMTILNKSESAPPAPSSEPSQTPAKSPAPLLKDPSVQKALDSLLGGDMFKNITASI